MSNIPAYNKALAIVPKCAGTLSFIGSFLVIFDICRDKKKRESIFNRIMLGLSMFDMIASFVNILSTWPTPEGTAGIYGASGTTATCTAQGFFNELGNITTPLYSAAQCVWYLLFLKYGWKEKDCRKYELAFHSIPISVGLTMAIVGLPLTLFNNSGFLCWYAPFPKDCDKDDTCTRGNLAGTFRWIHYGIIWSAILFITYAMTSIYLSVRRQEKKVRGSVLSDGSKRKKSDAVKTQALLYVCALYLTWFFTTCTRVSQTAFKHNSKVLLMLMAIFFPLQGFWNFLIYKRPQWLHQRRQKAKRKLNQRRKSAGSGSLLSTYAQPEMDRTSIVISTNASNNTVAKLRASIAAREKAEQDAKEAADAFQSDDNDDDVEGSIPHKNHDCNNSNDDDDEEEEETSLPDDYRVPLNDDDKEGDDNKVQEHL